MKKSPFTLVPEYRDYVWGGKKLRPNIVPTAEAWIVYAGNRVSSGVYAGRILSELAEEFGVDLLGARAVKKTGRRFPILVKILDAAQWLSLQVHPNDEQAKNLEGDGFFGKTEAWVVLENDPQAKLIAGMKPGIMAETLSESIRNGSVVDLVETVEVKAGDVLLMKPGTVHALGPGLLVYEIQQTSDITYRVYDWGRPQTATRKLHIDKALAVSNPSAVSAVIPAPQINDGELKTLVECEYFALEKILLENISARLDTRGESFHALTVIEGQCQICAGSDSFILDKFETLLIPAVCGEYEILPIEKTSLLKASL